MVAEENGDVFRHRVVRRSDVSEEHVATVFRIEE
jgi:hypothetical protein